MLFSRSVFSLLGRVPSSIASSRFLSSTVFPPLQASSDIDLTTVLPSTVQEYDDFQSLLTDRNRAPKGFEKFDTLRLNPEVVFRDFTPFFQQMGILEPNKDSQTALLRGRRWGKSVLGQGWLAFLRKEEHLFKGTAVEGKMRKEPLIGIELNLSGCSTIPAVPRNLNYAIIRELRRLRQAGHEIPEWPSGLSQNLTDPSAVLDQILEELEDISNQTKLKIALFVDEYDSLVIKALFDSARTRQSDQQTQSDESAKGKEQYEIANQFMTDFFTKLKSLNAIPFQFITGSSRLAIQGFWSGANNITDLSFDPNLSAVLGYTWQQIEQYFPIQLRWLQHLHKLQPEELRTRMEDWYDHHRWSPDSETHVFNPWSVNRLMATGKFTEHWARTGSNTRLLYSKLLSQELAQLLLSANDQPITIDPSDLVNPRLLQKTELALTYEAQKSLLVGAGMLAMHPDQPSPDSTVYLTIPNREAKLAIFEMLKTGLQLPESFGQAQVRSLIADQDFLGLINALDQAGALKATLLSFNDPKAIVSEERLSAAFTMIVQQSPLPHIEYRPMAAVSGSGRGRPLTCDQTFHLLDKKTTFVVEFKMTASRQTDTLKRQLIEAFAQCWWRYQDLVKEGFTGAYNVAVFDGQTPGTIEAEAAMGPLTGTQVENLLSESGFILENLPDKTKGKARPKEQQAQQTQTQESKKKPPAFNNQQLKQFDLQQWCYKNNVKLYQKPKAAGDSESQVKQE